MTLVAVAVLLATAAGIFSERHFAGAPRAATLILQVMLCVLVPFVSYVNIAHLRVTVGAGVGIGLAWVMIILIGGIAFGVGRRALHLPDAELGAVICSVVVANTGYLGLPMAVALLGTHSLGAAVAYDQLVSGPVLFTIGFGVGAAFGSQGGRGLGARVRTFFTRNPPLIGVAAGLLASPAGPGPAARHLTRRGRGSSSWASSPWGSRWPLSAVRTLLRCSSDRTGGWGWPWLCEWRRHRPSWVRCRCSSSVCPPRTYSSRPCRPESIRWSSGTPTGSTNA